MRFKAVQQGNFFRGEQYAIPSQDKVDFVQPYTTIPAKRGIVNGFSHKSRKRLFDLFNRIDSGAIKPKFITLTYQDPPTPEKAKRDIDTLFKRIKRKFPHSSSIWRMELQSRGAIHWHMIFFNLPYIEFHRLKSVWYEIVTGETAPTSKAEIKALLAVGVDIKTVRGHKMLMNYISKYVGKTEKQEDAQASAIGLINSHISPHLGRHWGIFNKQWLPLARKITRHARHFTSYYLLRAYMLALNGRSFGLYASKSFTIYTQEGMEQLERYLNSSLSEIYEVIRTGKDLINLSFCLPPSVYDAIMDLTTLLRLRTSRKPQARKG